MGKATFHFFEFEGLGRVSLARDQTIYDLERAGSTILDFAVD